MDVFDESKMPWYEQIKGLRNLLDLMTKNADKVLESITSSIPNDAKLCKN